MNLYIPVIALLVTIFVIVFILRSRFSTAIQDIPNERSVHVKAVPRTGGIGLLAGVVVGWGLMITSLPWWLVVPLLGLFAVSMLDDVHNLSVKKRLLAHLGAAAILVIGSGTEIHGVWLVTILFFFTVWMTNLYNFMDGSDGLAGGMALFGFGSYGMAALLSQDDAVAWSCFAIAGAAVGFLFFNFHPAKIFMGDAGSIPLGFLASGLGVWGWQHGDWSAWFPLLVFSPFIVDATVTLIRRALRGAKVTEAHREHYYQRAIQMGLGHRNLAILQYVLMACVGASGLIWGRHSFPWGLFAVWLAIYTSLMLFIDMRWAQFRQGHEK